MPPTPVDEPHWLDKFSYVIEKNILGVKLAIYGVGFIGLGIALRSVRPFKKIVVPNDIPSIFMEGNIKLRGKVVGIDFQPKTLILIDHEPLIGAFFRREGQLPVNLEGINVTSNGISWIQNIIVGKQVDFIVLENQEKYLSCLVFDEKRNIANHLVSIGFATVAPFNTQLESNEIYKEYYKKLMKTENVAERNAYGIWWDSPKRFSVLHALASVAPMLKQKRKLFFGR